MPASSILRSIDVGLTLHAVAARCRHRRPAAQKKTGLAAAATTTALRLFSPSIVEYTTYTPLQTLSTVKSMRYTVV